MPIPAATPTGAAAHRARMTEHHGLGDAPELGRVRIGNVEAADDANCTHEKRTEAQDTARYAANRPAPLRAPDHASPRSLRRPNTGDKLRGGARVRPGQRGHAAAPCVGVPGASREPRQLHRLVRPPGHPRGGMANTRSCDTLRLCPSTTAMTN